jgi:hypothetical protein
MAKKHCDTCTCHIPTCDIADCDNAAVYEGWARQGWPFNNPGMIFRFKTCEEHKMALIGFQEGAKSV